jgi:exodeoxyribonuclease V beta subunit
MTLLQASAGTGKTFTIAALTARYVAEGILPIDRLLVITFTRMATGELRERVRERLVTAFDGLVAFLGSGALDRDDEIVALLASGTRGEVEARRDRLGKAIAEFDSATIETTHGFCLQVLYGLGTAGDIDREVTLVEDVNDLIEQVVDDLYLRRFAGRPNPLGFERDDAMKIARRVLSHPDAVIVPPLSTDRDLPSIRRRFAEAVCKEMAARKRALKILTYDDVLMQLRDTLFDPVRGGLACARLRDRYDVVLVDEFQDTDPVQWDIMRQAFGREGTTLVLIGDPKQAIYAFRGADVHAYLQAADAVNTEWTLDVNWRSDGGLLEAYDALFSGARLGDPRIPYRTIRPADANREARLTEWPTAAPLRVRIVHAADGLVELTKKTGLPTTDSARDLIARDVAAQVVELLSASPEVCGRRRDGSEAERRPLNPGDLAVLVRANRHAMEVRDALIAVGVQAVIGGAGSVFGTRPAQEWLLLLEALERPTSRDRAAAVALTSFVGWMAEQVAIADEATWEDFHWDLHRWAALLREQGVAALFETVCALHGVPARVLGRPSGERFMTDLRHVAQLLHEAGTVEQLGPTAMATWLGRRIAEEARDNENEERTRRLESDEEAVQVITIHRSKGLEFPVVFCPFMWSGYSPTSDVPIFHDPPMSNFRSIDVAGEGNEFARHQQGELVESLGEDLRLLYVALTRAQHGAVLWWAGAHNHQHSPLSRLLFERDAEGNVASHGKGGKADAVVEAAFTALGSRVSVERVGSVPTTHWQASRGQRPELDSATFDRTLDAGWRRVSYSGITSAAHEQTLAVTSEPEQPLRSDEDTAPGQAWGVDGDPGETRLRSVPLSLAQMPGGALVGTVMHGVFENMEFDAADLVGEAQQSLTGQLAWRNVDLGPRDDVVVGLCRAIETPLGPLVDDIRLRDIGRANRLDELGFELPLVGGDDPAGVLLLGDIANLLTASLPSDDPVARYAERLLDPSLNGVLRGYLTGSLDLVLRLPGDRFVLADYKTNKLAGPEEELTAWHYRPEALDAEMLAAHYPLQALLYCVALHRYLRWRLPGYEPDRHFGGVLYLFVRGMSAAPSAAVDTPNGVWSWRPPAALVEALSELFAHGGPKA